MPQHPREHVVRKQADVVGEHAEDEPIDELLALVRLVARRHPVGLVHNDQIP